MARAAQTLAPREAAGLFLLHCGDVFAFQSPHNGTRLVTALEPRDCGGRVVLNNLSEQILECCRHAEDCARQAAARPAGSPSRIDYLQLEERWLALARSMEFAESLDSVTKNSAKPNIKPNGSGTRF